MTQIKKMFSGKYLLAIPLIAFYAKYNPAFSQNNTCLHGQINKSDGTPLKAGRVYLQWPELKTAVDSTSADSTGSFKFEKFPYGNYSIGVNVAEVDNTIADVISINALNPAKRNQHFKIDDGSLVCTESNYTNIKDALENKENVFTLNLNSLQYNVAEKSLVIGADYKKLSSKIGEFTNLESLSLDINLLTGLSPELGKLSKLTSLSASLNKLTALPNEMENLKNMKILNLGKNNFQQFPELITKYSALEVLNFENNPIAAISPTIGALKNLKELNISNCDALLELPAQIGELSKLETLDLSKCGNLKSLPEGFNKLTNLKMLDVTGTKISTRDFQKAVPGCEVRK